MGREGEGVRPFLQPPSSPMGVSLGRISTRWVAMHCRRFVILMPPTGALPPHSLAQRSRLVLSVNDASELKNWQAENSRYSYPGSGRLILEKYVGG